MRVGLRSGREVSEASRSCPMCGGGSIRAHFLYDRPPPLETHFPMAEGQKYWREMHRSDQCRHYLERFKPDQTHLYSGEYITATYGDAIGLRRNFERIRLLPPELSDNVARCRYVDGYSKSYFLSMKVNEEKLTLLDVGSGLGVFPDRMRETGWICTATDMDERLVEHHRSTVGIESMLGDLRDLAVVGLFDLIAFNKVLEHIEEPIPVLASAKRLLKPHGIVYIELPDGEAAEVGGKEREEYLLGHHHVFSFASYALLVAGAGMQLISCERLQEASGKYTLRGFARSRSSE